MQLSRPIGAISTSPWMPARAVAPIADAPDAGGTVEVWVPGEDGGADRMVSRTGGPKSGDRVVDDARDNGTRVLDYVQREFGRAGFDGRGGVLKLRAHAPDPLTGEKRANNAFWFNDEQRIWLGDGDGKDFKPLGGAADVIAHEFFHGVIDSEVRLNYVGQEGALHESFADVLATGVDGNWQIAERVFTPGTAGDALRDLSKLTYTKLSDIPAGEDEVHRLSEVASHAAYLVGRELGQAEMRKVWYVALTDHLKNNAGFAGARDATIAAAQVIHGAGSAQARAVIDAWAAVGITASTPKG